MISTATRPVLIAGAGPVGLSLAMDLAWRGVPSVILDPNRTINPHPRAISIGVRTMEHYRRMGIAEDVIDAGVPRDRALDVVYVTRILDREIYRFEIPSIQDLATRGPELARGTPELAASPYYKTWTAQTPLEAVLRRQLAARPQVGMRLGWRLESFREDPGSVEAIIVEDGTGERQRITGSYLVGCDGAASVVRKQLGIRLEGQGTLGAARGVYFRAPELDRRLGRRPGVMYWVLAPDSAGVVYTIDGGGEWVLNRYYQQENELPADPRVMVQRALGETIEVEILSDQNWLPRQLVAERYGSRRVFLAGDACHLFVPTGGFGMNTGIGDAVDLGWKIAAVLEGWGGPDLLSTYEAERRPIGIHNTLEAADNYFRSGELFADIGDIEEDGPRGEATRARVAAKLPTKLKHFAPIGVHLGYRYTASPLIIPDGTPEPPHEAAAYTPTARPGHRAPHLWLRPGQSTLDLFGRGFTLLNLGEDESVSREFLAAAAARGMPLAVAAIADGEVRRLYQRRLVLVRPDGHVAWRGDTLSGAAGPLLDRVRGAALSEVDARSPLEAL
ncbi:FAD-dependent monooxygenase [Roseomonas chloroacetimidivorans]|uniref:FAD-dependent monooxygenase n=1 Tax=Roseomonas chloroacetimidivorans TaxID=1766656 RepID=UPI003C783EA9